MISIKNIHSACSKVSGLVRRPLSLTVPVVTPVTTSEVLKTTI
jgi:hypothetical protein